MVKKKRTRFELSLFYALVIIVYLLFAQFHIYVHIFSK